MGKMETVDIPAVDQMAETGRTVIQVEVQTVVLGKVAIPVVVLEDSEADRVVLVVSVVLDKVVIPAEVLVVMEMVTLVEGQMVVLDKEVIQVEDQEETLDIQLEDKGEILDIQVEDQEEILDIQVEDLEIMAVLDQKKDILAVDQVDLGDLDIKTNDKMAYDY